MTPRNRRTEADYHADALARGGQWIGPMPQTTHHKTIWQCAVGHRWEAQLKNIESGRWCPICARTNKAKTNIRKTPDDYRAAAARQGFEWLGPEVENASTKTEWRCADGHTWWATYQSIANVGSGCPACANILSLTPAQFHQLAQERGIEWLGPACTYREKTQWRCKNGHAWWAQYGNIRWGRGCPVCKNGAYYYE